MKAVILMLGMMAVTMTDAHAFGSARSSAVDATPTPVPTTPVVVTPPTTDVGTGGLRVVINSAKNFNDTQAAHLEASRDLLERIVNSEEFKQRVLHFTYQGQETFVQNNGLSNLQVYNKILEAAEQLPTPTEANHVIDLSVQLYTSSYFGRNVVGYTDPSVPTIFMNTYFYNSATPGNSAGNMMHEWMHKIGFDHDYNSTARRPYSVPYAIGDIVDQMGN